jgi:hypothetical protein
MKIGKINRFLFPLVIIILLFLCCQYPKGSVAALTVIHTCDLLEPIDTFSKSVLERMRRTSEKRDDFTVVPQVFYNETNTFPSNTTHYVEIRLDTIFVLKIPEADKESEAVNLIHDKFRRAKDRLKPDIYINGLDRSKFVDYDLLFQQLGLNNKSTPFIGAEIRVIEIASKEVTLEFTSHVDLLSSIIISAEDQLAEMLTILRDKVQKKVAFLKA